MDNLGFYKENIRFLNHFGISNIEEITDKKIALKICDEFKENKNAQNIFLLCANMLSRIFLHIDFIIPENTRCCILNSENKEFLSECTLSICRSIFPTGYYNCILQLDDTNQYDGIIIIGNSCEYKPNIVYAISNGWNVYINSEDHIDSNNYNSIGACATACFCTSEIFKIVMKPTGNKLCNTLTFSLLNYDKVLPSINPKLPQNIDIGDVTLVGAGAIGSAFIYMLNTFEGLNGFLQVIDADIYTESNLNRYVIADQNSVGASKVENVANYLTRHSQLKVLKFEETYDQYKKRHPTINTLITAVDKRITRYNIQGDLPKLIIDASTTDSFVDISRVDFGNGGACLGCLYKPDEQDHLIYKYIAEGTGISIERVINLYNHNIPLNNDDILIASKKLDLDLSTYIGQPIDSLYSHEICGNSKVSTRESEERISAPVSFISAFAGIFIVSELIKDRYLPEFKINNHFYMNTFSIPNPSMHNFKHSDDKCIFCNDKDMLTSFIEKWPS